MSILWCNVITKIYWPAESVKTNNYQDTMYQSQTPFSMHYRKSINYVDRFLMIFTPPPPSMTSSQHKLALNRWHMSDTPSHLKVNVVYGYPLLFIEARKTFYVAFTWINAIFCGKFAMQKWFIGKLPVLEFFVKAFYIEFDFILQEFLPANNCECTKTIFRQFWFLISFSNSDEIWLKLKVWVGFSD